MKVVCLSSKTSFEKKLLNITRFVKSKKITFKARLQKRKFCWLNLNLKNNYTLIDN